MKLSAISSMTVPAFKGYEYRKNAYGEDCYYFNFPYDYNVYKQNEEKQLDESFKNGDIKTQGDLADKKNDLKGKHCYQECDLIIYKCNKNGDVDVSSEKRIPLSPEGVMVDLAKYGFSSREDFAYRYEIRKYTPQHGNWSTYSENDSIGVFAKTESLDKNGGPQRYQVVKRDAIKPTSNGNGYLAMVDGFAPGYSYVGFDAENPDDIGKVVYDANRQKEAEAAKRTFGLSYGGSLAGYKAKLDYLKDLGVKIFFSTPITGGDDVSYHKYWNTNNFQLAGGVGDMNNFEDFAEDLFSHGMSFVLDVPLTSEGLKGIHYQYALKWGDFDTPFRNWFRMEGLDTDQVGYGLVGSNSTKFSHYLVNAPDLFVEQPDGQIKIEKNPDYDASKPTEIQYFDGRYVSDELRNSRKAIQRYDILKLDNPLEVATHDDTAAPYNFRMREKDYTAYVRNVNTLNSINRDKAEGERVSLYSKDGTIYASNFPHTRVTIKKEAGVGYWDANTDMVKRRYFQSAADYKSSSNVPVDKLGYTPFNCQVQDEALRVGDFWSKKFNGTLNKFVARSLGSVANAEEAKAKIDELIASKVFPEEAVLDLQALKNIDADLYDIEIPEIGAEQFITKTIMEISFESFELDPDTIGVLATPMFTKYAVNSSDVGKTRYELLQEGNPQFSQYMNERYSGYKSVYEKVNGLLSGEVYDFTKAVLKAVDEQMPAENKIFADAEATILTDYGYYVVRTVGQDVAKYALMKSLVPNALPIVNSKGQIIYNTKETKANSSLEKLGVKGHTPLYEGKLLADVMQKGLRKVASDATSINLAKDAVLSAIKDTNANSFKYAEAIVKDAGINLDTRVDALKDYEDIDSVRNERDFTEKVKENLHYFWGKYKEVVYKNSPSARIWGEITDPGLIGNNEAELIKKTGLSSAAGYSFFFTDLTKGLAGTPDKKVSEGKLGSCFVGGDTFAEVNPIHKMLEPLTRLMASHWPVEYVRTIFNFGDNHDKPRLAYLMAVDLKMCHSVLNDLPVGDKRRNDALMQITGAAGKDELPFDVAYNNQNDGGKDYINKNYFLNASTYAIANGQAIRSKLREFLTNKKIIDLQQEAALHNAVVSLVNGNFVTEPVKRPSFYDYAPAMTEIISIAEAQGLNIAEAEKEEIISSVSNEARTYWQYKDLKPKNEMQSNAKYDQFKHYNNNNSPEMINVLCSLLRHATEVKLGHLKSHYSNPANRAGRAVNPYENSGDIYNKLEAAIQTYLSRYSHGYVNELLVKQQADLCNTIGDEKNAFGCMDIRKAIDLVFEKAGMGGKEFAKARFELFKSINDPAIEKVLMSTRIMHSLPGIMVNYGGNELSMGGYEEKTKNYYQSNREALLFSMLDGNDEEAQYYKSILNKFKEIGKIREEYPVLSNGFPRILTREAGNNFDLPGVVTTGSDGSVAVSIFNLNQLKTEPDADYRSDENKNPENRHVPYIPEATYTEIPLLENCISKGKVAAIPLAVGMILHDVLNKNEKVIVDESNGRYVLKNLKTGEKIKFNAETMKHGVRTFVYQAQKLKKFVPPSFLGLGNSFAVPKFNIVANPNYFVEQGVEEQGAKLSLISR